MTAIRAPDAKYHHLARKIEAFWRDHSLSGQVHESMIT